MQKRISRELRVNEVYESPLKHLQQSKTSREIGTSYDADDEDVFPESTTEEDSKRMGARIRTRVERL